MSLTRKMLEEMGILPEFIEKIIMAHAESLEALKGYKAEAQELPSLREQLAEAKATLSSLESYKEKAQSLEIKQAYASLLAQAGIAPKRFSPILKLLDTQNLHLSADGSLENQDALLEEIKREWQYLDTPTQKGVMVATPPAMLEAPSYTLQQIRAMSAKEISENYQEIVGSLRI